MSSNGRCFDIGITVRGALEDYLRTGEPFSGPTGPRTAGNGCIMRLAPVPMFFHPDEDAAARFSAESSRTTHGAQECIEACHLFGTMLARALAGSEKENILSASASYQSTAINEIASGAYRSKTSDEIHGTGYVVASLEAALWCFANTDSFESAVLTAVNLGDDADTTGAVCGQLAGAFYGERNIPDHWLTRLARRDEIGSLADRLRERTEDAMK
jgi:ADP-ribosyl-[dinitrogen reductase] hydrolase